MDTAHIRNFVIIAHVDHGKSTLADRMLEVTGTIPARRMRPQYLDQLDLERERGITIKMAPVRMPYVSADGTEYLLHLIDTPGHADFSYEVSRALAAVEGAVLLVDVTKGIQAQTLANLRQAKRHGLRMIGAVNKIDLAPERALRVARDLAELLETTPDEILQISGKTGEGVAVLLEKIVREVPPPAHGSRTGSGRALIFDSLYDDHKGILAYVRVMEGEYRAGDDVRFGATGSVVKLKETGSFSPERVSVPALLPGMIGYLATGFKEARQVLIGDTVLKGHGEALPGYREIAPVVFISFYPDGSTDFDMLKRAFERLRLTDAAISFEPDANEALGRGLKVGFLGQLHFEVTATRLEREFGVTFITSFPSIAYRVKHGGVFSVITDAHAFPDDPEAVLQPMIRVEIVSPSTSLNTVLSVLQRFDCIVDEVKTLGDGTILLGTMPLAELIRDFDDQLKSASQGYASFTYEPAGEAPADVEKLEILVANDAVAPLTRVVFREHAEREARATVERLKELLPHQQFAQAIQARVRGRIVARETIAAMRKDVTGYLYGGDRSRKMKLWKKQKEGKARLKETGKVAVPVSVFKELLKK